MARSPTPLGDLQTENVADADWAHDLLEDCLALDDHYRPASSASSRNGVVPHSVERRHVLWQTYTKRCRYHVRGARPTGYDRDGAAPAFAFALAFLASGTFLVLLPVVLIRAIAYRLLRMDCTSTPHRNVDIIDGEEYVVLPDPGLVGKASPVTARPEAKR